MARSSSAAQGRAPHACMVRVRDGMGRTRVTVRFRVSSAPHACMVRVGVGVG